MKKIILSLIMVLSCTISSFAQSHSDRLSLGVGALYERGLDATIAWEHETRHHNAWEYFINGYINGTNVLHVVISVLIHLEQLSDMGNWSRIQTLFSQRT